MLMFFLYFVTAAALAFLMSRIRANQSMLAVRARRMVAAPGLLPGALPAARLWTESCTRDWSTSPATSKPR